MHISRSIMQDEPVFLHIIALIYAGYAVVHDFLSDIILNWEHLDCNDIYLTNSTSCLQMRRVRLI